MSLDHYSIADLKNLSDHIPSIRAEVLNVEKSPRKSSIIDSIKS
jgi:hypothetical protein